MRVNRLARLNSAKSVVVDNFHDFGVFNALNRLPALVVVDENNFFAFGQHNFIRADQTDEFAVFDDGIAAVTVFVHDAFDVAKQIHRAETDGVCVHYAANRHALIEQTSDGVSVIRSQQHEDFATLRVLQHFGRNAAVHCHDKARYAALKELQ